MAGSVMNNSNQIIPANRAISFILMAIFVLCPLYAYRDAPELFGSPAIFHLSLVTAFGGGISAAAYFFGKELVAGLVSGVIGGVSLAYIYSEILINFSNAAFATHKMLVGISFIISLVIGYLVMSLFRIVFKGQA